MNKEEVREFQKNNKLKPEFKKQWVEALRSGKYSQGEEFLCKKIASRAYFCCLGVAAMLPPIVNNREISWKEGFLNLDEREDSFSLETLELIFDGLDASYESHGITLREIPVIYNGKARSLASLNDKGHSFEEIADVIEEQY